MSIQSEVSRIDGAKGALKTAIEGKGVAVPEDTRIDGYAALVDELQHGTGDMKASVYDPQNKAQDMFAYADGKAPLGVTITEDDESGEFSSNHDAFEICDAFRAGRVVFANVDEDVWMLDRVFGNRDEYGRAEAFFRYYTLAPTQDANDAWHFGLAHMEISVTTQATDETSTNFETLVGMSTKQIDAIGVGAVPSVGGTMTGALTLSGAPAEDLHAATKKYVDDSVPDVTGKADKAVPSAAGNVAALGADGNLQDSGRLPESFATVFFGTGTLTVSGWQYSSGFYVQTIGDAGTIATDTPFVDYIGGTDSTARPLIAKAWSLVASPS